MKLLDFSQSLNEFYEKGHDKEIKDLSTMLSSIKEFVLGQYNQIDEAEFAGFRGYGVTGKEKKEKVRLELEKKIEVFNSNVKACANPKMNFDALVGLYSIFFDQNGNILDARMVTKVKANTDFYRMRSAEGYMVYSRDRVFQIAGENRKLTSKLRFSDDGHPCLYLGASLYIAWEEVRRASLDTVNFARFRNTRQLSVLDLTVRKRCKGVTDFYMSYISLLTSGKVEDGDKYKYRYEVSGLLMKLLQNSIAHKGNVDGIKYVSSRQFDGKDIEIKGQSIMEAYVFPPRDVTDCGVDNWLRNTFEVSAVRSNFLYNIHRINYVDPKLAVTSDYQRTLFFELEQLLKKEKMEKVKD